MLTINLIIKERKSTMFKMFNTTVICDLHIQTLPEVMPEFCCGKYPDRRCSR